MLGTLVNTGTILLGSGAGLLIGSRLGERGRETALEGVGLAVVWIGMAMALKTGNPIGSVLSLAAGGVIGEALRLEEAVERWEVRLSAGANAMKGFFLASLMFLIGPMAVMGSLADGLTGDSRILFTKAVLDGITSFVLSGTFGWPVILSAGAVLLYQGGITLLAQDLRAFFTPPVLALLDGVGGLLILGIGLNMLKAARLRLVALMPSLLVALLLGGLRIPHLS